MKRVLYWALPLLVLSSCIGKQNASNSDTIRLSEREEIRYNNILAKVEEIESQLQACEKSGSTKELNILLEQVKELRYDYNSKGMNSATEEYCNQLRQRIVELQQKALAMAESSIITRGSIPILSLKDRLLSEKETTPLYLNAGELLFVEHTSSEVATLRINNADTHKRMKSYSAKSVKDSLKIAFSGIYTIDLIPSTRSYSSLEISVRPSSREGIYTRKSVHSETVQCNKGDWGAKAISSIKMHNCFEEPRKFTLRGQLKAMFSGNAKALVAVQVPAGTTDILYSMRVATSEQSRSADGEFHNNLTRSYKKIKMLGMPLYEKESNRGVFVTLLDDNRPIREEDAYCNMYVFRNKTQAKQFQDGTKAASQLSYDVDYSTLGTQSCNGRIPTKGLRTIYLGFENERVRYTNYLWVEVVAVVPTTEYYTTKYSVQ